MRLVCYLREIRGKRPVAEIAEASGIHRGTLSRIERGMQLPSDGQIAALTRAYGYPPSQWYSPSALLAIQEDLADD